MHKLADDYQMNLSQDPAKIHPNCKTVVRTNYIKQWEANMFKFKVKFKIILFKKYKKIYKYRMKTETLEGLYVPSSIFNSLHNNILFCDNTG